MTQPKSVFLIYIINELNALIYNIYFMEVIVVINVSLIIKIFVNNACNAKNWIIIVDYLCYCYLESLSTIRRNVVLMEKAERLQQKFPRKGGRTEVK